ncbi:protein artichoke-like [Harmonia axyridis]|uniref:protein artichoke-like n=1 Tax=Harmonia axyridis TaxID=115357 RepID=UPI001E279633|nr:protein artichoke-like [Harmonia axyridis]
MSMIKFYVYMVFLIATFNSTFASGSKCPKPELIAPCRCLMKREERQVWCSHSDLPKVLSGLRSLSKHLSSPIDELILENNYLPSLPARTFSNLKILRIMLRQNGLERVAQDWLHGLEDVLMELFIVEPKLRYLPEDSLSRMNALEAITIQTKDLKRLPQISSLAKLRYLQVESLALVELSPRNFKNLPALEKFHLGRSKNLKRLEAGLFENLPVLKSINMSNCGIFWIHPRTFSNLPELKELSFMHNSIRDAGMVGRACKDLDSLKELDLDYNRIEDLPKGSFVDLPTLRHLRISFNNILEIKQGAFHRVPRLKDLYLNNNRIRKIHPESFIHSSDSGLEELWLVNNHISQISELRSLLEALPRLVYLDMSSNELEVIPFGSLHGHPTLEVIKLNSNKIRRIDKESFMAMPALRELSLRNNSLSNYDQGPLWNLPFLKGLDLSQNNFRKLDPLFLANLPSLRRLDVSDNELVIIDPVALSLTPLIEYVNISDNNLRFIHPATFKRLEKLYELDVSKNYIEDFPVELPEGLEYLHLNFNKLRTLPSLTGSTKLYSLKHLDLSYNLIGKMTTLNMKKLPSLKKLYLSNNFVQRLEDGVLEGLPKLEIFDLSANKIVYIHPASLRNLHSLVELNLRNNYIESIFVGTLQGASKLVKLDVSGNKLVEFLQGNMKFNLDIKHLNISRNFLIEMPRNIFKMKQMMVLDMSRNRIKNLPVEAFSKLEHLTDLRLSNNFIRELRLSTFSRLKNLRILYLDHNDIDEVETNTFQSLPSLEMIKLDNNKLSKIPSYTLNNLTMLQVAEFQSNNLEILASDAFNLVPNLLFLNISRNNLRSIEDSGLRNVPSLEVLDLSSNLIRRIEPGSFRLMEWLVEIKLDHNEICGVFGTPFSDMPRLRVISLRGNKLRKVPETILDRIRTNIAVFDVDENPLLCDCNALWLQVWAEESMSIGPHCGNGKMVRELKIPPSYCKQKPMKDSPTDCDDNPNGFSQVFSKYSELRNGSSEDKTNILAPLPQESDYFYDQYVDYPFNESLSLNANDEEGILDRFLKVNHSSLMEPPLSSHVISGDTPTLYAAPSNNKIKPDIPKEVPHSPSSSGFTFFGVPLSGLNLSQFLGGNKKNLAKSASNAKSVMPIADRKMAIMNIPVVRGTTARNIYREPPSTPFIETGGFRPILPGEGGFLPMVETTISVETSTELPRSTLKPIFTFYEADLNQKTPEDSSTSASSPILQYSEDATVKSVYSSTERFYLESTTHSSTEVLQESVTVIPTSTDAMETSTEIHVEEIDEVILKNQSLDTKYVEVSSTASTEFSSTNVTLLRNVSEGTTQSTVTNKDMIIGEEVLVEENLNSTNKYRHTSTQLPTSLMNLSTTEVPKIIQIDREHSPSDGWDRVVVKTRNKGTILDKIAIVPNTTKRPETVITMPALSQPQLPHIRSAGRSIITKVQSPFTTGASALVREVGPDLKETGETVTLDPQITKLDGIKESWYFANYNKSNSEPYLGVNPNGGAKIGGFYYTLVFSLFGTILFGIRFH